MLFQRISDIDNNWYNNNYNNIDRISDIKLSKKQAFEIWKWLFNFFFFNGAFLSSTRLMGRMSRA